MALKNSLALLQFKYLDDFVAKQNNFFLYFIDECLAADFYRTTAHFQRFQNSYSQLEQKLTLNTVKVYSQGSNDDLPFEKLRVPIKSCLLLLSLQILAFLKMALLMLIS